VGLEQALQEPQRHPVRGRPVQVGDLGVAEVALQPAPVRLRELLEGAQGDPAPSGPHGRSLLAAEPVEASRTYTPVQMTTGPVLGGASEAFREKFRRMLSGISSVILGQETVVEELLVAALARGHALIEGVPGLGKTRLVRAFAEATDLQFARIQFTPDLMPADVTGTT